MSSDQHRHLSEKGWVLLESVLSEDECHACVKTLDRLHAAGRFRVKPQNQSRPMFELLPLRDDVFLAPLRNGLLNAVEHAMDAQPRVQSASGHINLPHADRHTRAEELMRPETWGWHRFMRPKWGSVPSGEDSLRSFTMLNSITYLTPAAPGSGGTAVLSGSHLLDDSWATFHAQGGFDQLRDRCELEVTTAAAGSTLLLSEALLHAAVPVIVDEAPHKFLCTFTPSWWASTGDWIAFPERLVAEFDDPQLQHALAPAPYFGQRRGVYASEVADS